MSYKDYANKNRWYDKNGYSFVDGIPENEWTEQQKNKERNYGEFNPIALLFFGAGYYFYGREFVINHWQIISISIIIGTFVILLSKLSFWIKGIFFIAVTYLGLTWCYEGYNIQNAKTSTLGTFQIISKENLNKSTKKIKFKKGDKKPQIKDFLFSSKWQKMTLTDSTIVIPQLENPISYYYLNDHAVYLNYEWENIGDYNLFFKGDTLRFTNKQFLRID